MTTPTLTPVSGIITTTQAARKAGLTRQGILARVKAGTLTPIYTHQGNGGHLFKEEDIEASA